MKVSQKCKPIRFVSFYLREENAIFIELNRSTLSPSFERQIFFNFSDHLKATIHHKTMTIECLILEIIMVRSVWNQAMNNVNERTAKIHWHPKIHRFVINYLWKVFKNRTLIAKILSKSDRSTSCHLNLMSMLFNWHSRKLS
jgi:hypothetical protein